MGEEAGERLTVDEVAERVGVSRRTVARWCEQGRVPGAYKVGTHRRGVWVIPAQSVEELKKRGK